MTEHLRSEHVDGSRCNLCRDETWTVRVTRDELDGGFIAEFVDFPGCMSQGATISEVLYNVADAAIEVGIDAALVVGGDTE